jgi:hypothetical protein
VRFRDAAGCAKLRGPYTLTNERTGPIRLMRDALDVFNSTPQVMRAMKLAPRFEARKSAQYGGDGGFATSFIAAGEVVAVLSGQVHWGKRDEVVNGWNTTVTIASWSSRNQRCLPEKTVREYEANMDLRKGAPSTYCFNHSCAPNCEVVAEDVTFCDYEAREHTWRIYYLTAVKDIEKGAECTFCYNLTGRPANGTPCRCQAALCRGRRV